MPQVTIPNNWVPRWYQLPLWKYLEGAGKRAIEIWHRRAGKDDIALHWTAFSAMQTPANYWHMLPKANQARKALWDAVNKHSGKRRIDEAFPQEIRANTRDQDMFIRFVNGSTWQVIGSDNYDALVGSPPYGVVFSEWALANPSAWGYLKPILDENQGWALFITTPRGDNHAKAMLDMAQEDDSWFCEVLTVLYTKIFTKDELDKYLKEYIALYGIEAGQAFFEQEYLCSFEIAMPGAYLGGEMRQAREEGRIRSVPYEPGIPVDTYWDLGIDDSMTIWFVQTVINEHRFIDYHEDTNLGLTNYADVLYDKAQAGKWEYGRHVAPHDISVRELTDGISRLTKAARFKEDKLAKMSILFEKANRPKKKENAIQSMRDILPKCWFDKDKCERGLNCLRNFRKEWDDEGKIWSNKPVHDWSIHGADAFQTFAISQYIDTGFFAGSDLS